VEDMMKFTREQLLTIVNLAESGERIPANALLGSSLGTVTEEDIRWAKSLIQIKPKKRK
jgi:hypothetical protein